MLAELPERPVTTDKKFRILVHTLAHGVNSVSSLASYFGHNLAIGLV
jgi:hypothetical protein